jgi:uncharacterized sodium:solute symporter family permease YidK
MFWKKVDSRRLDLTPYEIVHITIFLLALGAVFFVKYLFPDNPSVARYFTGGYGFLWLGLLAIWALAFDRQYKKKREQRKKDHPTSQD